VTLADLARDVARCLGLPAVELVAARAGGASHLAYEVRDPKLGDGPIAFLRCESGFAGTEYGLRREAEVLPAAAALGLPVPEVLGTPGDPPGLLMNLVAGTSQPQCEEAEAVAAEYMALVARVHAADPTSFPLEQFVTVSEALVHDLDWWTRYATATGALDEPLIRLGARVLGATRPAVDGRPSLIHGDVGPGNFMVDHGRVSAMLDWELAHVGDPHEDLAWLWMRGAHTPFGDPQQRVAEYEAAAGVTLDHERLRWHLAFVMWKSCVGMYGDLRQPPNAAAFVHSVVILTYDALLGAQLVQLLGGSLELLAQEPVRRTSPQTRPADYLLETSDMTKEARLALSYLRDAAAQAAWERDVFVSDSRAMLGVAPGELLDLVDSAAHDELLALAMVLGRAADRSAMALPNAVRRIHRAQGIGLGTGARPSKGER